MEETMICRHVRVDRNRSPQEALDATGRVQTTEDSLIATIPNGKGEEVDFYFFKPSPEVYSDGFLSKEAVENELNVRGLEPDPYAQMQANTDDPAFADDHPNGVQLRSNGRHCVVLTFSCSTRGRRVDLLYSSDGWSDDWWLGGVKKSLG